VNKKGWLAIEHYMVDSSKKPSPMQTYNFMGVPHVMLVDKSGTVVFKGHPMLRNLEADMLNLANDKPLD